MLCCGAESIWRCWFDGLGWNKSELQNGPAYCAWLIKCGDLSCYHIATHHRFVMRNNGLTLLQQDTARPHTARITTDFLHQQAVKVMPWPSVSPDLNPIEHLWDELGQRVRDRPVSPQNLQQLEVALNQECAHISQNAVRRYVHLMPSPYDAVIAEVGGHTRY